MLENLDSKKIFIKNAKNFYFIVDQFINITFLNEKPENLPNKVIKQLTECLNTKDLGSLKEILKDKKNETNKILNETISHLNPNQYD